MSNYNVIHSDVNTRDIGTVTFYDFSINESTIGSVKLRPIYVDIRVYAGEGPIPHFHLITRDKSFDCCICIFDNYYFNHGTHQSVLNTAQRKSLNEFLSSLNPEFPSATIWETIRYEWIVNNKYTDGRNGDYPLNQPDYTEIRPFSEYKTKKKSEKAYIKKLYKW